MRFSVVSVCCAKALSTSVCMWVLMSDGTGAVLRSGSRSCPEAVRVSGFGERPMGLNVMVLVLR